MKTKKARQSYGQAGIALINAERQRQITQEGFTKANDAEYKGHQLILAADSYLNAVASPDEEGDANGKPRPCHDWPWPALWWKPSKDPVRNLVKAGALIAAEIDRLLAQQEMSVMGGDGHGKATSSGLRKQKAQLLLHR